MEPLNLLFKSTFISLGFKCLFFVISYDNATPHDEAYLIEVGVFRHTATPVDTGVVSVSTICVPAGYIPESCRSATITVQFPPDTCRAHEKSRIRHAASGICKRTGGGVYGSAAHVGAYRLHPEPSFRSGVEGHVHDPLRRGLGYPQLQAPRVVTEIIAALPVQTAGLDGKAADLSAVRLDSTTDVRVPGLDATVREDLEIAVSRNKPLQFDLVSLDGDTGDQIAELVTLDIDLQVRALDKAVVIHALGEQLGEIGGSHQS